MKSAIPADLLKLLRHEVALITVKTARAGLRPLFHQRFSTLRHEVAFITVMPVPQEIT
jgi:hypothetical protein